LISQLQKRLFNEKRTDGVSSRVLELVYIYNSGRHVIFGLDRDRDLFVYGICKRSEIERMRALTSVGLLSRD
jgi:hypothetical protein